MALECVKIYYFSYASKRYMKRNVRKTVLGILQKLCDF